MRVEGRELKSQDDERMGPGVQCTCGVVCGRDTQPPSTHHHPPNQNPPPTPHHPHHHKTPGIGQGVVEGGQEYYTALFRDDMKRDPTNVELFDIAQSNSEHSRHWFFRGEIIIDGVKVRGCAVRGKAAHVENGVGKSQGGAVRKGDRCSRWQGETRDTKPAG